MATQDAHAVELALTFTPTRSGGLVGLQKGRVADARKPRGAEAGRERAQFGHRSEDDYAKKMRGGQRSETRTAGAGEIN